MEVKIYDIMVQIIKLSYKDKIKSWYTIITSYMRYTIMKSNMPMGCHLINGILLINIKQMMVIFNHCFKK